MGYPRVTPAEVKKFHKLYAQYGNYAEVARRCGRSATTVAKYIKASGVSALGKAAYTEFIKTE